MWLETRSIDGGRILKVYRDVGFNEGGLKTILSGRSKMGKWRIFGIKILLGGGKLWSQSTLERLCHWGDGWVVGRVMGLEVGMQKEVV